MLNVNLNMVCKKLTIFYLKIIYYHQSQWIYFSIGNIFYTKKTLKYLATRGAFTKPKLNFAFVFMWNSIAVQS